MRKVPTANDRVEERSERDSIMASLQLLDSFVEVNDAVQQREDVGAEGGNILHCLIVGVEYGE